MGILSDEDMMVDKGNFDFIYSCLYIIFFNDADSTRMIGVLICPSQGMHNLESIFEMF